MKSFLITTLIWLLFAPLAIYCCVKDGGGVAELVFCYSGLGLVFYTLWAAWYEAERNY